MPLSSVIHVLLALALAPMLFGIINRTKAAFAGRNGAPLLQVYYDLAKLLRKGAVYSRTTTVLFRVGPLISLAAVSTALLCIPMGGSPAVMAFPGDLIFVAYLLALGRFLTVTAALDTGSSFEGMGASREVHFSVLAELALFLCLATLAWRTESVCLSEIVAATDLDLWFRAGPELVLIGITLFLVLLTENSRIPVDDPNTHLELTMVHEVMVLDHGGPDLAAITFASALKLWIFCSMLVGIVTPLRTGDAVLDGAAFLAAMALTALVVGIVESTMARLRLVRVPQLIIGASALSSLALVLSLR
jgi:formate hydrogenlyase subunit 4